MRCGGTGGGIGFILEKGTGSIYCLKTHFWMFVWQADRQTNRKKHLSRLSFRSAQKRKGYLKQMFWPTIYKKIGRWAIIKEVFSTIYFNVKVLEVLCLHQLLKYFLTLCFQLKCSDWIWKLQNQQTKPQCKSNFIWEKWYKEEYSCQGHFYLQTLKSI